MKFNYNWKLSDLKDVKSNGLKVFSCFACGGGSTMGYKMSGFEVIGANDIDPEMMSHYLQNHKPKYHYLESIETFKNREDLPQELFNLDILDGSPPCSSFSMAGSREEKWGVEKKFREGQAEQVLDDLFFHFIDLAKRLQPKVVISENVKGMLMGNAKGYVKEIINKFDLAGYDTQLFLMNGATMGLPQKRERVFFISRRKDLNLPKVNLIFNEKTIPVKEALSDILHEFGQDKSSSNTYKYWKACEEGKNFSSVHPKGSLFNHCKISPHLPFPTLHTRCDIMYRWEKMCTFTTKQLCRIGSYPSDYKFGSEKIGQYLIGMSVPPLMTHKISKEIAKQLFKVSEDGRT